MTLDRNLARRILRFTAGGLMATAVHAGVAALLIAAGAGAGLGNGAATIVAAVFSYTIHTLWSFSKSMSRATALRFSAVTAFCAGVAAAVGHVVEVVTGHPQSSILAVVLVVPPLSFLLHNGWTYRR